MYLTKVFHGSDNNDKMLNTQQQALTSIDSSDYGRQFISNNKSKFMLMIQNFQNIIF